MALRGTLTHRKTRRLAKLLGISPCFALGVLESLWHFAGEQRLPNGDLSTLSPQDLADEIFYDGDADALLSALQEAGWLTADVPGVARYVVGWDEHADSYVHAKLVKATARFANGVMPRVPHDAFNADTRKRVLAAYDAVGSGREEPKPTREESPKSPGPPRDSHGTSPGHTSAGGSSGSGSCTGERGGGSAAAPAAVEINGQWAPLGTRLDHPEIRTELARIEQSRALKKPRPLGPVPFGDVEILASVATSNGVSDERFLAFLRYVNANRWASAKGDMLARFLRDNPPHPGTYNPGGNPERTPEEIEAETRARREKLLR